MQESNNDILVNINYVFCIEKNSAITVCTSQKCLLNPFLCVKESCPCRKQIHKKCQKIPLAKIWNKAHMNVVPFPSHIKPMAQAIQANYDRLIEQLSKRKVQFTDSLQLFGFQQHTKEFITKINDGILDKITGKMINKVLKQLQSRVLQQVFMAKLDRCAQVLKKSTKQIDQISKNLRNLIFYKKIDSKYLTIDNQYEMQRMFQRKLKSSQILYRARENKYCSLKFHQKCDLISDTLTIVKTNSGNIIGGYTPCQWESKDFALKKEDRTKTSFLFSLNSNQKYQLKTCNEAITCYHKIGPIFGNCYQKICYGKYDDRIVVGFNILNSYQSGPYLQQQKFITQFCGGLQNEVFSVEDYQVHHLVFSQNVD